LSPDAAFIAFDSWTKPDPVVRLILADVDGSKRRVIARLEGEGGYQRWSPDSSRIACVDGFSRYVGDLATGETRFGTAGRIESWVDDDHVLVS
jgi:Tol biopolymer transport system component